VTDEVLFRMQLTHDGVLTITRAPRGDEAGVAAILRLIADSLESGATRLVQGEVPE